MDALDLITKIGSLVGFVTGGFVVFKDRPHVYLQPESIYLRVVVRNNAKEPILIKSIKCRPEAMAVSYSISSHDIMAAISGKPLTAMIAPETRHYFAWIEKKGWTELAPDERTLIEIHWVFTRLRWLPQYPVRVRNTVGRLNELRQFVDTANRIEIK